MEIDKSIDVEDLSMNYAIQPGMLVNTSNLSSMGGIFLLSDECPTCNTRTIVDISYPYHSTCGELLYIEPYLHYPPIYKTMWKISDYPLSIYHLQNIKTLDLLIYVNESCGTFIRDSNPTGTEEAIQAFIKENLVPPLPLIVNHIDQMNGTINQPSASNLTLSQMLTRIRSHIRRQSTILNKPQINNKELV